MPAALGKSFKDLTEEDLVLIKREDLTNEEICDMIGIARSGASLSRWRKTLGIKIKRGSKPGIARPWQEKKEIRKCKFTDCNNTFNVVVSSTKKYCCRSCGGKDRDTSYMQSEEYRSKMRSPNTSKYKLYYGRVYRLTEKIYNENYTKINPNGYIRGLCGVENAWQLDHIIPVRYGFDNNIPEEVIASIDNLQMLYWKDNVKKGCKYNDGNNL